MLAQRLRRWPNINPVLVQRLVSAGKGQVTDEDREVPGKMAKWRVEVAMSG